MNKIVVSCAYINCEYAILFEYADGQKEKAQEMANKAMIAHMADEHITLEEAKELLDKVTNRVVELLGSGSVKRGGSDRGRG